MKKMSSKPAVYLIDGSNFSRSFMSGSTGMKADGVEAEFLQWLAEAARTELLRASCFRVVFDGGFRPTGAAPGASITVYFSDDDKADDVLIERARFLGMEGVRTFIVTSDRDLARKAAEDGTKSLSCGAFFRLCENELRKGER